MLCGRRWVIDGGLGSALQCNGFDISSDPLWSARILVSNPDAIKEVHKSYLEAGAEILITSSYQTSVQGFRKHMGVEEEAAIEFMKQSVHLANEAVEEYYKKYRGVKPLVAGSIGPYGACQADGSEYDGKYASHMTTEELMEWHKPRIAALTETGVNFLAVETIPSLKEALAVIKVLRTFPVIKAWVSFSCKDGHHTNYGDKFRESVKRCYEEGGNQLIALGTNCTPPQHISSLLQQANIALPPASVLPRVIYPNSGEKWIAGKGWEGRSTNWPYVSEISKWMSLGASVIGGCCRLGPCDIKNIAQVVMT
ncbi:hypothetical protein SK128_001602 [Halocaridina rubra]|uniref:Hcy-binding domain-containing protein n=1 Tax=Halocaridina rubra TaxID=373956 RepID=A0AAN8WR30_HALRR